MSAQYTLTSKLIAAHVGAGVLCLAGAGEGRRYSLHPLAGDRLSPPDLRDLRTARPDASLNLRAVRDGNVVRWVRVDGARADLPSGAAHVIAPVEAQSPLIMVRIQGPLEQRAGYQGECGGWSDGHDAVADRLCAAFAEGDVLLVVDSPGGAAAGLPEAVDRALEAKAKYGRRVTAIPEYMIGSAATWWTMALSDEIFLTKGSEFGSIGARGDHRSIAGMLAEEGVTVEYFTWPNAGKVAFAPELPTSDTTRARGNRDVSIAGEAFCEAVISGPVGKANGLTREAIVALSADMLPAQLALDAGHATGIASFDEVVARALQLAESPEARAIDTAATAAIKTMSAKSAKGAGAMSLRAEDEDDKAPPSVPGKEPSGKCAACGMQNEDDAKFCDQCGKSMAAKKADDGGDDDDEKKDERASVPPPSSKPAHHPPPPERMAIAKPAKMIGASTASVLEATSDNPTAIQTAAIDMRRERDWLRSTLFGVTGKTTTREAVDEALAIPTLLARGRAARKELADSKAVAESKEHRALCLRYVELNPKLTSRVLDPMPDAKGNPRTDRDGNRYPRIRTEYRRMSVGTLRTLVRDQEGDRPPPRAPWEPGKERAENAANLAAGGVPATFSDEQKKRLEKHPDIELVYSRGSAVSRDKLVTGLIATNPQSAARWLAQNGAAS